MADRDEDAIFAYDASADALYYRLSREHVARTVEIDDRVMIDIDDEDHVVGIEVLNPPGFSVIISEAASG